MLWTLSCNGTEQTLATWGLNTVRRKIVSQGLDELTFRADGTSADAAPLFTAFGPTVTLYRNRTQNSDGSFSGGTPWFSGIVTQIPRAGAPDAESMQYKVAGPWWYLDNMVFMQPYQNVFLGLSSGTPQYAVENSSHLFLNQSGVAGLVSRITTGAQITAALQWALLPFTSVGAPAPFQIGTITPALDVPIDEVRDITCAEVIHKMLRWSPDAVTWFDYTTSPPTFNCLRRADMSTINLSVSQT
jgi:hypothetical protein